MMAEEYIVQVLSESTTLNVLKSDIHGVSHWIRVWQNARKLAETPGVDMEVVVMFALFHDSMRDNDGHDSHHGSRGWQLWVDIHRTMSPPRLKHYQQLRLSRACIYHDMGETSVDPTIGVCWDADRLDLPRVGIIPDPKLMSTTEGARLASRKKHVL